MVVVSSSLKVMVASKTPLPSSNLRSRAPVGNKANQKFRVPSPRSTILVCISRFYVVTEDAPIQIGKGVYISVVPMTGETAIFTGIAVSEVERYHKSCNGVYARIWDIMSYIEGEPDE
jgi:hypothetical protein